MNHYKLKHGITILLYISIALILSLISGVGSDSAQAAGPFTSFPGGKRGQKAIEMLRDRLPDVASRYGLKAAKLRAAFLRNADLYIDPSDKLVYLCNFDLAHGSPIVSDTDQNPLDGLYPYELTFQLHSAPGASKTIYLDFDGHVTSGTIWNSNFNGNADINSLPFDIDGNPYSFSNAELDRIQNIWERLAEDFAHYNIDVTTEDPGVESLRKSDSGDEYYGIRVVISPSSDWYGSAGGVAYIGSFAWTSDTPTFVFSNKLANGNEKYVAEASSHETGHTLGLFHDGKTDGTEYYAGHGDWAPIMGVSYYKLITQWSKGEYAGANNTEDDLARMLNYGADYRLDDHGNGIGSATLLTGVNLNGSGVIERNTDVDVFSFQTGAGEISINVDPAPRDVNLDIELQLLDSGGNVIAEKNDNNVLAESLNVNVSAGTYYIRIDGAGTGDPNTGYSDYASLGQYFISGTVVELVNDNDSDSIMAVDDNAAVFSGSWPKSTYRILYYGDDYQYAVGSGSSSATATATFTTPYVAGITGEYQVYVRWTAGTARATNATYRIEDNTGAYLGNCTKDQRYNGGAWQFCDDIYLNSGKRGVVKLTNTGVPTNRYVCADAVRFVRVSKDVNDLVDAPGYELAQSGSASLNLSTLCSTASTSWNRLATLQLSNLPAYGMILVSANGISKHINNRAVRVCIGTSSGCTSLAPYLQQSISEVGDGSYANETRWVVSDTFPSGTSTQTFYLLGCRETADADVTVYWDDFTAIYLPKHY